MKFDKDEIKEALTLQQVMDYVAELGGEPRLDATHTNCFVSRTICHNPVGEGSHKLYYYENTHLFRCYTYCGDTFDIFDLTRKWAKMKGEDWPLPKAVTYVARYFGIAAKDEENFDSIQEKLQDWDILRNYANTSSSVDKKVVEFREFDETILKNLPRPRILPWEAEGITREVMESRGICYDPVNQGIVIPHYQP